MKSQDIVILLKLLSLEKNNGHFLNESNEKYSMRALETALGISKSEINSSINRSLKNGMATRSLKLGRPKPVRKALYEFIIYGIKYVFPTRPSELTRGMPTAFSAPILKNRLSSGGDLVYVWPDAAASVKGQAIKPLFKSVSKASLQDPLLYDYLALVDAVRIGNPRETNIASDILKESLLNDY